MLHNAQLQQHSFTFCTITPLCKISAIPRLNSELELKCRTYNFAAFPHHPFQRCRLQQLLMFALCLRQDALHSLNPLSGNHSFHLPTSTPHIKKEHFLENALYLSFQPLNINNYFRLRHFAPKSLIIIQYEDISFNAVYKKSIALN